MTESQKSVLYEEHVAAGGRMAAFAGYVMPLWYSSITAEHQAVRTAAGLFDCTHMGVLEFQGPAAEAFLNVVATNDVSKLTDGKAQYSYVLDENGRVLDDILVYRRSADNYMVVVNAANEPKIKAWLASLRPGAVLGDDGGHPVTIPERPEIIDLRDPALGPAGRVDLALQGPHSLAVIEGLLENPAEKERLRELRAFRLMETQLGDMPVLLSRTGYTGAAVGYEIFVPPVDAPAMWRLLLDAGADLDVTPCGLGARDSLRIEAGLPLYGHELAGKYEIGPYAAGYGWAVKPDKGDFIGKAVMLAESQDLAMAVQRLSFSGEKGVRPVREGDAILDGTGKCLGWVLSATKAGEQQVALAYMAADGIAVGDAIGLYYVARNPRQVEQGRREKIDRGEKMDSDLAGQVLERFARF